jgi:transcriptional regulator with XRE-family HTH domain
MDADREEVQRLLGVLRTLMRMLAFSNREVERRLGLNHGSVSRVFSGHIEAKLELVLAVARAIGLEYDEFFALAYPDRRPAGTESPAARKIASMLEDLRPVGSRPAPSPQPPAAEEQESPSEPFDRDTLIADLKKVVREIFAEAGNDPGPKSGNGGD